MKSKHLVLLLTLLVFASPLGSRAQQAAQDVPLLTLDDAVSIALENNRLVKNSSLEARKFDFRVGTGGASGCRSSSLPFWVENCCSHSISRSRWYVRHVCEYWSGTVDGHQDPYTGPVCAFTTAASMNPYRSSTRFTLASAQPNLHARSRGRCSRGASEDRLRGPKRVLQSCRDAGGGRCNARGCEDAGRSAARHREVHGEKTVLRADALEVDARLAKAQYDLSVAENGLATQREHLNQLLGRDLTLPSGLISCPKRRTRHSTLQVARDHAEKSRPEIRQAQLKQKQAEYDRRIAKAEYIPDLSVSRSLSRNEQRFICSRKRRRCGISVQLGAVRLGPPP